MAAWNNANYAVDEVTESRFESRLDEIIEKMIGDDHWKVKIELLDMFLDLFFEPGNKRFENERMVKIKKMIGKYAERLVSKIHDKDPRVQLAAMVMMSFLEPHVLARYVHDITPMLKDDTMRWDQSASPAGAAGARKSGAGGARKGRRTYHHGARQRPPARRSAETVRGASVGAVATAVLGREAAVVVGRSVTEASASAPAWGKAREVVTHHRRTYTKRWSSAAAQPKSIAKLNSSASVVFYSTLFGALAEWK